MAAITKVVNFRVPYDVYEDYLNESKLKNISLTDCILGRLNEANKVVELTNQVKELNALSELYMRVIVEMLMSCSENDEELKERKEAIMAEFKKLL